MKNLISHMTWVEAQQAAEADKVVLFPIGSMEGNGPRNVIGYDYFVSNTLARMAAERTGNVWIPALPYGIPMDWTASRSVAMNADLIIEMVGRCCARSRRRLPAHPAHHQSRSQPGPHRSRMPQRGPRANMFFASINPAVIAPICARVVRAA